MPNDTNKVRREILPSPTPSPADLMSLKAQEIPTRAHTPSPCHSQKVQKKI